VHQVLWTVSLNAILVTAANTIYMPGFKQVRASLGCKGGKPQGDLPMGRSNR
jgi:hypothetical protein